VLGDNIGYGIGRVLGRALVLKHGKKIGLDADRLRKVEDVFARFGPATVAFARFVNVLRQLNRVVAGTLNMDWRRFLEQIPLWLNRGDSQGFVNERVYPH
jgi:membrane protein DedA with SNARE-associated domain